MRDEVRKLLQAHTPADEREAGFVEVMLALLEVPGDSLSRQLFTPGHFTASAFVTSPDGGSLLLVHHGKLHRWLQPGGHIEPEDADLFAAVLREVREEVGLHDLSLPDGPVLFDVDIHDIPSLKGDPAHRHYDLRVHLRSPTLQFQAGSDARAAKWVALGEVDAEESDESVMRAVRKLLAPRGR
jgi:8-oxo-dGTP pyrophosphatase MutT (NUDIX family)